jgi:hypothetical protein
MEIRHKSPIGSMRTLWLLARFHSVAHSPIRRVVPSWLLNCLEHLYEFLIAVEEIEGDKGHRLRL